MKRFWLVLLFCLAVVGAFSAFHFTATASEPKTCEEKAAAGSLEFCEVEKLKLELYRTKIGALADKQNDLQKQINELTIQYKNEVDAAARLRGITATAYKYTDNGFEKLPTPTPSPSPSPTPAPSPTPDK